MFDHEYSVLGGFNRANIGHTIGVIAAAVSSAIVTTFLWLVDYARQLGFGDRIPSLILWPISAGLIYALIYWLFNKYVWKIPQLNRLLKVPDLAGDWDCEGQTINPDKTPGYSWEAKVTITQSWDKIRVRLKTEQSGSNSIAAALLHDEIDGYRLLYNYKNDPNVDEPELQPHRGFADITFAPDLKTASGEYFNGHGRFTFGTMKFTRLA
jgi:hypothetical protein